MDGVVPEVPVDFWQGCRNSTLDWKRQTKIWNYQRWKPKRWHA